jgi:hypothetical protein
MRFRLAILIAFTFLSAGALAEESSGKNAKAVPFPTGFRNWKHIKSMLIYDRSHALYEAFAGIHHVYANDIAFKALKSNSERYPKGSVFVFDLLEGVEKGGAYTEGKRKFVAAIIRDPKKYAETEGWGWQVWEGGDEKKVGLKALSDQKACATCHLEVAKKGLVFTSYRP